LTVAGVFPSVALSAIQGASPSTLADHLTGAPAEIAIGWLSAMGPLCAIRIVIGLGDTASVCGYRTQQPLRSGKTNALNRKILAGDGIIN
jgi:hypothetical protein